MLWVSHSLAPSAAPASATLASSSSTSPAPLSAATPATSSSARARTAGTAAAAALGALRLPCLACRLLLLAHRVDERVDDAAVLDLFSRAEWRSQDSQSCASSAAWRRLRCCCCCYARDCAKPLTLLPRM